MDVFVDGDRVYSVSTVIKDRDSGLNSDCDNEEEVIDALTSSQDSDRALGISRRMLEQFFTEVEGPDRDWQRYEDDVFAYDARDELILGNSNEILLVDE